jgi:HPt (histidine-containing phosphotransfer) domain-containing protein
MNDYISKPVKPDRLLIKLAAIAARKNGTPANVSKATREPAAAPVPAEAQPLLDTKTLIALAEFFPHGKLAEFTRETLRDAETRLARIAEYQAAGDWSAVGGEAHALVGTHGNMGAMAASAAARKLEEACRGGDAVQLSGLVDELRDACRSAAAALDSWTMVEAANAIPPDKNRERALASTGVEAA